MYTVEFEPASTTITTLDEHDAYDDVEVIICEDDTVFIKQHIQDVEEVNVIYMSYGQLLDILAGLSSAAGAYRLQQESTG